MGVHVYNSPNLQPMGTPHPPKRLNSGYIAWTNHYTDAEQVQAVVDRRNGQFDLIDVYYPHGCVPPGSYVDKNGLYHPTGVPNYEKDWKKNPTASHLDPRNYAVAGTWNPKSKVKPYSGSNVTWM